MVLIDDSLEIPDEEFAFTTSRSGGPGGQNVNKLNTRVTLLFDVDGSPSLNDRQRTLLHERAAHRINKNGVMRVVAQRHRTQLANREEVLRRFADVVRVALTEEAERIPVSPPPGANARRLDDKRRRGRLKRERSDPLY